MLIVSSGEFRANQKDYLDKVDKGEEIVVQRGKDKSYKIVPVKKDDTLMTREEFFAKIDRALKEADEGKMYRVKTKAELKEYINNL